MEDKKNIAITADSTCDLPDSYVKENEITVIPLSILLGDKVYHDGVDIKPADIYKYVDEHGTLPQTSAVTPAECHEVFKRLTDEGKKAVHIGFSSGLCSSLQNACVAAVELHDAYCVDSKRLCTAMGLLLLKACAHRST